MKRTGILFIMAALCCLLLAGCEPSVQTDYPRDKIYEAGETIHVYDMDTGDLLLSLTPVGAAVYSDEEQIWELDDGVNSDGEAKTKPITIRQQIAITLPTSSIRMLPNRPSIASISIARRGRAAGRLRKTAKSRSAGRGIPSPSYCGLVLNPPRIPCASIIIMVFSRSAKPPPYPCR